MTAATTTAPAVYAPLTGDAANFLTTGAGPLFPIYQDLTQPAGYAYNVQVECDNDFQKIYHPIKLT